MSFLNHRALAWVGVWFGLVTALAGAMRQPAHAADPDPSGSLPEEFWDLFLSGETLRYIMPGLLADDSGSGNLRPLVERLQGVRIYRQRDRLMLTIRYDQGFQVVVRDGDSAPSLSLYEVDLPPITRFALKMRDGVLTLKQLDLGGHGLRVRANIPWLPDTIWVHGASVDLVTGDIRVEAGVLGNLVRVVAKLKVNPSEIAYAGLGLWEHITEDLIFDTQTTRFSSDSIESLFNDRDR